VKLLHGRRLVAAGSVLGLIFALLVPAGPARADAIRSGQWYLGFLNVAQAHRYSEGAGVTVGLLDTGVDATHPDLVGSVLPGTATFPGASGDGRVAIDEHGTRMAGLIGGHGHGPDGSLGVLGIAPKATILPVRIGQSRIGSGIIPGIEWATTHGANVISISFGDDLEDSRERQAIEDAIAHDIVVVAGVGNRPESSSVGYPAAYPGVVAVAGVDENGNSGRFSVTGPGVVVAAPGANILTTGLNHGYGTSSGTSDSTAIVAGVAALIRSKYPNLSAAEVVHRLTATATDKGPPGRDDLYGYGIVNPVAALTADVPPLSPSPSAPSAHQSVGAQPHGASTAVWLLVGLGVLGAVVALGIVLAIMRGAS
jgi:type VII secretion-associated serine protease mycosin